MGNDEKIHSLFRMITLGRYWLVLSSLPSFFFMVVNSIDTLTPNQSLRDGELLISAGETYALGFFGPTTSNRRYVGIWYHKIPKRTVVWVANREIPLNGTSGVLSFNPSGYIFIYDHAHNVTVWQTNTLAAKLKNSSCLMRLMDSGNLVLFKDNDASLVVWQSFDYPSNTMLPNMKLGLDRRTGFKRLLTSWKSINDPSPGEYSLRLDFRGLPQLVLQRGAIWLWRSGPWIGGRFSGIPNMTPNYNSYVDNDDEVSVEYSFFDSSILMRLFVDELGFLHRQTWDKNSGKLVELCSSPKYPCDYYGHCGSYGNCKPSTGTVFECTCLFGYEPRSTHDWHLRNRTGGCVRKRQPVGVCDKGDGFLTLTHAKLPDVLQARYYANLSTETCRETCLKNCSCTAYTTGGELECITWHGDLIDSSVLPEGGQDLYIRVDTTELVTLIAKLQHRNLVQLLGCCIHQEERMLVYEYMPNGSLDLFIFGMENKKHKLLTWRKRLDIIIGIARGLLYLHQDSQLRVIHRDLKISNILLDSEMNPKISDFGLARAVGEDQSSTITKRVVGT
ncbi:hypothetical protein NMG60_11019152 [Bertholletia excelsa]